jgi:AcrR family transcriptional regulator
LRDDGDVSDTQTRRRENTRARLVAAAEGVFAAKGVRRVTVDDLVGAAGFTRGAFYSNFSSIEEVFFAVFQQLSEEMLARVRTTVDETPEGEFTLEKVINDLRPVAGRWYAVQAEFTLLALRSEEARVIFREHHDMFEDQMLQLIEDVMDRLGRVPEVPLRQLTETVIALYLHALLQESLGLRTLDLDELTGTVLPGVMLGLSREKDR